MLATANLLPLTPGEIVLGNRIRSCFAAHVADDMLPKADEDLVAMVRHALQTHTLNENAARVWVVFQIHAHKAEWETTEAALSLVRVNYLFAGKLVRT